MAIDGFDWRPIATDEIDPDSPLTTTLCTKWRDNQEFLMRWLGRDYMPAAVANHNHDGLNSAEVAVLGHANIFHGMAERTETEQNVWYTAREEQFFVPGGAHFLHVQIDATADGEADFRLILGDAISTILHISLSGRGWLSVDLSPLTRPGTFNLQWQGRTTYTGLRWFRIETTVTATAAHFSGSPIP